MVQKEEIQRAYETMLLNKEFLKFVNDNRDRTIEEIIKRYNVQVFKCKSIEQKNG